MWNFAIDELTQSKHRIHCISIDSFANYQGFSIYKNNILFDRIFL